jgi:hypothetical protein
MKRKKAIKVVWAILSIIIILSMLIWTMGAAFIF